MSTSPDWYQVTAIQNGVCLGLEWVAICELRKIFNKLIKKKKSGRIKLRCQYPVEILICFDDCWCCCELPMISD